MRRGLHLAVADRRLVVIRNAIVFIFVVALLGGCTSAPSVVPQTAIPSPPSTPTPAPASVAILISDRLAAFQQVADALETRLPRVRTYTLDGDSRKADRVLAELREDRAATIVAIGSLATRVAGQLSDRTIVFCQDFNASNSPARASVRGVRATPPVSKQLAAWKMLAPQLQRVVLITGPGARAFVREASTAAGASKIQLEHIEVRSDRELLYAIKRVDPAVQGLWFAPDNRVLSTEVLREALAHSVRQGKQTLVFNAQLLELGALLSVESDPDDIAERVVQQLGAAAVGAPRVVSLHRVRADVNTEIAERFGLQVPVSMQAGSYVF